MEKFRLELVEELASKGNPDAIFEMERFYFRNTNSENKSNNKRKLVIKYLVELAEKGNSDAMLSLGSFFYEGNFVEQNFKEAVKWYEKAAENLDEHGLCYLGYCYFYGRDVDVDYAKAFSYFSQSAFLENANGMFKLGDMYFSGHHVKKDKHAAFYWYDQASNFAETPYEIASIDYRLAECYIKGNGVEQDLLMALSKLQNAELIFLQLVIEGDTFALITLKKVEKSIEDVRKKLYKLVTTQYSRPQNGTE